MKHGRLYVALMTFPLDESGRPLIASFLIL